MSLSPFISFQSQLVTYLLTFPRILSGFECDLIMAAQHNLCVSVESWLPDVM
jgi:hypothetical protein